MTLFKLIIISTISIFMLLLSTIFFVGVHNAKESVSQQLTKNAKEAKTRLQMAFNKDITLMQSASDQKKALDRIETSLDTLVNTSYQFSNITIRYLPLLNTDDIETGKLIASKNNDNLDNLVKKAKPWFIKRLDLQPVTDYTTLSSVDPKNIGAKLANLILTVSPTYLYDSLWENTRTQLGSIALIGLLAMIVLSLLLRIITTPLRRIRKQAQSICERRFTVQEKLPRTRDLKVVVEAMNQMSMKIKTMINDLTKVTLLLRNKLHQNKLTGFANYHYFRIRLRELIRSKHDFTKGTLFFGNLQGLQDIYHTKGSEAGDKVVSFVAAALQNELNRMYGSFVAYISHDQHDLKQGTFAIVAPNFSMTNASLLANQLSGLIREKTGLKACVAILEFQDFDSELTTPETIETLIQTLLTQGAETLKKAEQEPSGIILVQAKDSVSETQLLTLLQAALRDQQIMLEGRPVVDPQNNILHKEIIASIAGLQDEKIHSTAFKLVADKNNLAIALDQLIISRLIQHLNIHPEDHFHYAINISYSALQSNDFIAWLNKTLTDIPTLCSRLSFELYEQFVLKDFDEHNNYNNTIRFIDMMEKHHCDVGLNRACQEFSSIDYIEELKNLDYIKINGGNSYLIHKNEDTQILMQAVIEFLNNLNIKVIAEQVDLQEDRNTLESIGIDGIVGTITQKQEQI